MIKIKAFGTPVYISYPFLLCVILLITVDRTGLFLLSYCAVSLHEIGHLAAIGLLKERIISVSFSLGTVKIIKGVTLKRNNEFLIALSGPLTNLLLSLFIVCEDKMLLYFGMANLVIAIFNLLPVNGLDGGDIIKYILFKLKFKNINGLFSYISYIVIVAVFIFGFYIFVKSRYNITLIIAAIYLFILSFIKE